MEFFGGAGIEMYEVMALHRKFQNGGREVRTALLAAAFLAAFAYFGWKYATGGGATFPICSRVFRRVDGFLEQARDGRELLQAMGQLFCEVFMYGAENLF